MTQGRYGERAGSAPGTGPLHQPARYLGLALEQVRPALGELSEGLLMFQTEAHEEAGRSLDDLFTTGHPNRVALLDPDSLEGFLEGEARRLAGVSPSAVLVLLWRGLAPELVDASTARGCWEAVERAADRLAGGLSVADRPLGEACRAALAERYRPESLRSLLVRLARPRRVGEAGPPAIESHAASSLIAANPEVPFVLAFHWRDEPRRPD